MNTMRVCLLDQLLIPKAAVDEDVHLQTVGLLCAQYHLLTSGQLQTYLKRLCTCESRHPLSAEVLVSVPPARLSHLHLHPPPRAGRGRENSRKPTLNCGKLSARNSPPTALRTTSPTC
jgi:hypothetical protein